MLFDFITNSFQERLMWGGRDDGLVKRANGSWFTLGRPALWRCWWGRDGLDGFRRSHRQRGVHRFQKKMVSDQESEADRKRDQDMANIAAVHWV